MHTKGKWEATTDGDTYYIVTPDKPNRPYKSIAKLSRKNNNTKANAGLIVAAVNACQEINPDNPIAVAESIGDMREAGKNGLNSLKLWASQHPDDEILALVISELEQALIKAEGGLNE